MEVQLAVSEGTRVGGTRKRRRRVKRGQANRQEWPVLSWGQFWARQLGSHAKSKRHVWDLCEGVLRPLCKWDQAGPGPGLRSKMPLRPCLCCVQVMRGQRLPGQRGALTLGALNRREATTSACGSPG
jgi:hypothetical protein